MKHTFIGIGVCCIAGLLNGLQGGNFRQLLTRISITALAQLGVALAVGAI